ncbi:MAG: DUF58 domain-containing protein [Chloroherpetonaceae bacterium]|nr:DUF58 domain-containing protein [Chloroherpetonaceae bacterium]
MNDDYKRYLLPDVISKIKSFELRAKFIVEGFITGMHKSPYHGFSVEFAEHRQYTRGDELRHLDWKVFARTGKYYIKQYEEETNLRAFILLDTSSSMKFQSSNEVMTKIEYSSVLAAALSSLMMGQRDAVGLVTFNTTLKEYFPPSLKASHYNLLLKTFERISKGVKESSGEKTDLATSLSNLSDRLKKRSLIIVLSDFWDSPERIASALKHFHHQHHEIIVFHILDPKERTFDFKNSLELVDSESGERIATNPELIKRAYAEAFHHHTVSFANPLMDSGIEYTMIDTSEPFDIALLSYLKKRTLMMK